MGLLGTMPAIKRDKEAGKVGIKGIGSVLVPSDSTTFMLLPAHVSPTTTLHRMAGFPGFLGTHEKTVLLWQLPRSTTAKVLSLPECKFWQHNAQTGSDWAVNVSLFKSESNQLYFKFHLVDHGISLGEQVSYIVLSTALSTFSFCIFNLLLM